VFYYRTRSTSPSYNHQNQRFQYHRLLHTSSFGPSLIMSSIQNVGTSTAIRYPKRKRAQVDYVEPEVDGEDYDAGDGSQEAVESPRTKACGSGRVITVITNIRTEAQVNIIETSAEAQGFPILAPSRRDPKSHIRDLSHGSCWCVSAVRYEKIPTHSDSS
jgi:hypothetical protein